MKNRLIGAVSILALMVAEASATGLYTNGVPPAGGTQYPTTIPLTGNETFPADTNLTNGQNPGSESVSSNQLGQFFGGLPSRGNALIGGDATTNLWQRNTTGNSQTTTVLYGGPDRWAYWSGTGTAMTIGQDSTAADLPSGYKYAFKMARTAAQTGIVQMCMAQVVESANSYQFDGTVAELDFHAITGANFSPTNSNMTAYIITGSGTDEGMTKLAFGLNGGGGGSTGWTGQANATAAVISLGGVSTAGRYAAFATIPATTTEVAVALCFTPVGTAGTNDYVAFSGIQLIRNNTASQYTSATVGYNSTTAPISSFERRPASLEAFYQYRYYYIINEVNTANVIQSPGGYYDTTTTCSINFLFPAPMYKAPVIVNGGITATTFKIAPTTTPVVLAGSGNAGAILQVGTAAVAPFTNASVSFKTTAETQYVNCDLVSTAAGGGVFGFNGEE